MKIIGISGKSGSGKTSLIRLIRAYFSEQEVCILSLDNYYRERTHQKKDDKGYYNFDLMTSFDWDKVMKDINQLVSGQDLVQKQYVFNNEEKEIFITYKPAKVLIIEGIFVLAHPNIWNILDYSIIIDADNEVCRNRRLTRDVRERNYDEEEILHRFDNHVLPSYNELIEPLKPKVDLVLINEEELELARKILIGKVLNIIN